MTTPTPDSDGRIQTWAVTPDTGDGTRSMIGVAAIGQPAVTSDGGTTLAGIELAIPADVVSEYGTVRFDTATAREVIACMQHAVEIAETEAIR